MFKVARAHLEDWVGAKNGDVAFDGVDGPTEHAIDAFGRKQYPPAELKRGAELHVRIGRFFGFSHMPISVEKDGVGCWRTARANTKLTRIR